MQFLQNAHSDYRLKSIFLLLLVGILTAFPAHARDYLVEVLVFENPSSTQATKEQWELGSNSQLSGKDQMDAFIELTRDYPVTRSVDHLQHVVQELQRSGYRILYTGRWQQPPAYFHNAPVVPVQTTGSVLQGGIRVYNASLIFVDLSLGLADRTLDPSSPLYFIHEKRRVKFKEVHYFDHPRFGAILTVWPIPT